MLQGQIKLSRIFEHNFDKRTDSLYQPLRQAVQTMPSLPSSGESLSAMKCSQININRAEQDAIRNSTFIPINKKLVETNNPEKHLRARSRSYRTLSVEQRIGSPLPNPHFQLSIVTGQKQEIVYDYDTAPPTIYHQAIKLADYYSGLTATTLHRARSATYVGGPVVIQNRPERVETTMMRVERKPSDYSGTSKGMREGKEEFKSYGGGEYYEECKKYAFKGDMKEKPKKRLDKSEDSLQKQLIKTRMATQGDYKYNIFNVLDDPINSNCASGCGKNTIIAPPIKKRW